MTEAEMAAVVIRAYEDIPEVVTAAFRRRPEWIPKYMKGEAQVDMGANAQTNAAPVAPTAAPAVTAPVDPTQPVWASTGQGAAGGQSSEPDFVDAALTDTGLSPAALDQGALYTAGQPPAAAAPQPVAAGVPQPQAVAPTGPVPQPQWAQPVAAPVAAAPVAAVPAPAPTAPVPAPVAGAPVAIGQVQPPAPTDAQPAQVVQHPPAVAQALAQLETLGK